MEGRAWEGFGPEPQSMNAILLLVAMPGATSSVLAPNVAMPLVASSFLLLKISRTG